MLLLFICFNRKKGVTHFPLHKNMFICFWRNGLNSTGLTRDEAGSELCVDATDHPRAVVLMLCACAAFFGAEGF